MSDLIFAGPLPPPTNGQAMVTDHLLERLKTDGLAVGPIDTGVGRQPNLMRRAGRHLNVVRRLLTDPARHFYISVNEHKGMILTVMLCSVARLRRKSITLHHHSARFTTQRSSVGTKLVRAAGAEAVHLFQGSRLAQAATALYGIQHCWSYSNVGLIATAAQPPRPREANRVHLGHLSNLSESKGIGRAIETLRAARGAGIDARLTVGGPCADDYAVRVVAEAAAEFGADFIHIGPAYGEAKAAFYRSIDVFVFPTEYIPETQGLVNLDALANGVPVISFDRGCIGDDIGTIGGRAVSPTADFAAEAVAYLRDYLRDPDDAARKAALRFNQLLDAHGPEHERLLARFLRTPDAFSGMGGDPARPA